MSARSFFCALAFLSFAVILPLWISIIRAWPISTDLIFYSTVLKEFSHQFWSGELYPRWLMNVNDGFGAPVFVFYPPITFYAGSLFEFLSPLDPNGLGRTLLTMQLALVAGGVSAYYWLRLTFPESRARLGALLYATFPSLALVAYYDFGISQLWGFAIFPLLILAAHRLVEKDWRGVPLLSAAYALLALTHLPSTLIFSGVPVLYAAFFAPREKRLRLFILAMSAGLLGAALAAFFLLPTRASEAFITMSVYLKGNGDYALNFWKIRNLVAAMLVLVPLLGFFLELPKGRRREFFTPQVRFWLGIIALFLFMTSYLSYPLWQAVTPLHYLQFPWRMLVAAVPAATYVSLYWLPHVKSRTFFLWFSGLVFGVNGFVMGASLFFDSPRPLGNFFSQSLIISQEYRTGWMAENDIGTYRTMPEYMHAIPPAKTIKGHGKVEVVETEPRRIVLSASILSKEATVQLRRFYFPGWQADMKDAAIEEHKALLAVRLPRGKHEVTLTLPWFAGQRDGALISVMAFLLWGWLVFMARRKPYAA